MFASGAVDSRNGLAEDLEYAHGSLMVWKLDRRW